MLELYEIVYLYALLLIMVRCWLCVEVGCSAVVDVVLKALIGIMKATCMALGSVLCQ